jgi:hypothetical protein
MGYGSNITRQRKAHGRETRTIQQPEEVLEVVHAVLVSETTSDPNNSSITQLVLSWNSNVESGGFWEDLHNVGHVDVVGYDNVRVIHNGVVTVISPQNELIFASCLDELES